MANSREYLEEALAEAKKQLPGWAFASLRQSARARAGGRARHRVDEPSPIEKIALAEIRPDTLTKLSDKELNTVWQQLVQWFNGARRRKQPIEDIVNAALWTIDELKRRGKKVSDVDLVRETEELRRLRKSKSIEAKLEQLPSDLVVVQDFLSLVGSAAKGKKNPKDLDLLVRASQKDDGVLVQTENVWLPVRNVLDESKKGNLSFIFNAQGAHGDNIPLYDLVMRRRPEIKRMIVKQDAPISPRGLTEGEILEGGRKTKDAAKYREPGEDPDLVCGTCRFYLRDEKSERGRCQVVSGSIAWFGTSDLYISAEEASRHSFAQVRKTDDKIRIDLGCGDSKPLGYVGIDVKDAPGVDMTHDLEKGIPYADGAVDVVRANHFLEHIGDKEKIMAEIHRALRPGGRFEFEVPSTSGEGAFAHPSHKSYWNKSSFAFWAQEELCEDRPQFKIEELDEERRGGQVYVRGVMRKPLPVQKALDPFQRFTPPKPVVAGFTELFDVEKLWDWAQGRLPVAIEPKHNGFRAIVNKKGDRTALWFEGQLGKDQLDKLPGLRDAILKIKGDYILDADVGIERDGKRVPRPELQKLNADRPQFKENERVVLTVFDAPFVGEDISGKSFRDRRKALDAHVQNRGPVKRSPLRWIDTIEEMRAASKWAFGLDKSEGVMAKSSKGQYEVDGETNEWSKLKRVAELKVIVLDTQKTKKGDFNYSGGLSPGKTKFKNTKKIDDKTYVDLGKTFNTKIEANKGDILTVQVLELVPNEKDNTLTWLGGSVVDIDRTRSTPFSASQAIDISRRADVLQKSLDIVPATGEEGALVAFVGVSPTQVEAARGEPMVGPVGATFRDLHLKSLGLKRDEVALLNAVPEHADPTVVMVQKWAPWLKSELERIDPGIVVALGQNAREILGDRADFVLPHPLAIRALGDRGEVQRKAKRILKAIEKQRDAGEEGSEETRGDRAQGNWEKNWHKIIGTKGGGKFVYQHHWRGLEEDEIGQSNSDLLQSTHSLHGDIRLEGADSLFGWAVFLGSAADNRKVGGDKLISLKDGGNLRLAPKLAQPKQWLNVGKGGGKAFPPGGPGATSQKWSKFFIRDRGTYKIGVVQRNSVELFLDGKDLNGRYLITFPEVETGKRIWLIDKPKDQTPRAEREDLADEIGELRRKRRKFLIWSQPGEKPRLIDVRTGRTTKTVEITKADPAKRIVYGIVLDPYGQSGAEPDAHNDWMPPGDIEKTAHSFMDGPKAIGFQHKRKTEAKVIESSIEDYPSRKDYEAAMENRPHRVWRRPFGNDVIHSGAWRLGVKLGPKEWEAYKRGKITAFSPGGFGARTKIPRSSLPKVTFVDLVEGPAK